MLKNSEIIITDGFFVSDSIKLTELDKITFKSIDSDGFILFEVNYVKPKKTILSPQVEAGINGYTFFHSSIPKSKAYGTEASIYEYYKRERDLSYYTLIKRNSKIKKIVLGSLLDPNSRIYQIAMIINHSFRRGETFDRKKIEPLLPSRLRNRRIIKSVLDVLTAEGFLKRTETELRGKLHEEFIKTEKLEKFMFGPRPFVKSFGVSVERSKTSAQ